MDKKLKTFIENPITYSIKEMESLSKNELLSLYQESLEERNRLLMENAKKDFDSNFVKSAILENILFLKRVSL